MNEHGYYLRIEAKAWHLSENMVRRTEHSAGQKIKKKYPQREMSSNRMWEKERASTEFIYFYSTQTHTRYEHTSQATSGLFPIVHDKKPPHHFGIHVFGLHPFPNTHMTGGHTHPSARCFFLLRSSDNNIRASTRAGWTIVFLIIAPNIFTCSHRVTHTHFAMSDCGHVHVHFGICSFYLLPIRADAFSFPFSPIRSWLVCVAMHAVAELDEMVLVAMNTVIIISWKAWYRVVCISGYYVYAVWWHIHVLFLRRTTEKIISSNFSFCLASLSRWCVCV